MVALGQLGGMIPVKYLLPEKAAKYDEVIIINWLDTELPSRRHDSALEKLRGWRNREVYGFVKKTHDDWFNQLATKMYGRPKL